MVLETDDNDILGFDYEKYLMGKINLQGIDDDTYDSVVRFTILPQVYNFVSNLGIFCNI